ncbi:hypothetical protein CKAN_02154700 [Cinnamomum micranthum f. kanehirae]|uniref:Uncharacterized protein n=1 Tax=Cinnamomum micranthum f. kanehirae TaxID=337451 RepID=A0A443PNJ2_9MAGN|nr:hypothetical protein CKAN_02154700 [Cinnamomum micranthum f. kanehirae]
MQTVTEPIYYKTDMPGSDRISDLSKFLYTPIPSDTHTLMSRCFPYPPPGYEARERPELELLQREREKAKERKQRKKERRERKEKSRDWGKLKEKKHSTEDRGKDRQRKADQTRGEDKKRKLKEVEQVEKSNITEEHGQPASTMDFCGSSDRTQSSAKRRNHDIGAYAGDNQGSTYKCNALKSGNLRMEAQRGDLLDNWKPLELQIENPDFDCEDWLLEKKQQGEQGWKNCTVVDNSSFWTSCYFPVTEMSALPYVVPY